MKKEEKCKIEKLKIKKYWINYMFLQDRRINEITFG